MLPDSRFNVIMLPMRNKPPVVVLALDAVEGSLVDRLVAEGRMPHLAALRDRGVYGKVHSRPEGFLSMVWPTFFTGQTLGAHGWYFNKLWSADDQCLRYVDPSWLPIRPFWEDLGPNVRAALLDVPFSPPPGSDFNGVFLNGWQAHDDFGQYSVPPEVFRNLRVRHGRPAMTPEIFGPQDTRTLERQRHEGIASLRQFAEVVLDLLGRERWDLLVAVFGGAHRAGHYLWSLEEADVSGADPDARKRLEGAREELYIEADRAVGEVVAALSPDTRLMVFSLHGMGRNRGWAEHFGALVNHLHARGRPAAAPKQGLVYRLKNALPWTWVRQVTTRLPGQINHRLVPLWSRRMLDWSTTRYFALPLDLNGYLRVNVRGRDAEGIVEPGDEYEALLDELTADFLALRDLRDDEPIVAGVDRVDDLVGRDAPRRKHLPDLVVRWTDTYAHGSPGIRTPYGELRLDPTKPLPSGRSGNHTRDGWFVATGPGVGRGRLPHPVDSVHLPATLMEWVGAERPSRMEGKPLPELAGEGQGDPIPA